MNFSVLYHFIRCLNSLPGKPSSKKVYHSVAYSFKIVTSCLFYPLMSFYRHKPRSSDHSLSFFIWNMLSIFSEKLCQAEIDYVDDIWLAVEANYKVLWLYVSVENIFAVESSYTFYHLDTYLYHWWELDKSKIRWKSFTENYPSHFWRSFSRFNPNKVKINALNSSSLNRQCILGKPNSPLTCWRIFASRDKVECFLSILDSSLIAIILLVF